MRESAPTVTASGLQDLGVINEVEAPCLPFQPMML
jgi:hypothetical protein